MAKSARTWEAKGEKEAAREQEIAGLVEAWKACHADIEPTTWSVLRITTFLNANKGSLFRAIGRETIDGFCQTDEPASDIHNVAQREACQREADDWKKQYAQLESKYEQARSQQATASLRLDEAVKLTEAKDKAQETTLRFVRWLAYETSIAPTSRSIPGVHSLPGDGAGVDAMVIQCVHSVLCRGKHCAGLDWAALDDQNFDPCHYKNCDTVFQCVLPNRIEGTVKDKDTVFYDILFHLDERRRWQSDFVALLQTAEESLESEQKLVQSWKHACVNVANAIAQQLTKSLEAQGREDTTGTTGGDDIAPE
ncbi:MAG: hypothetical protein ACRERD_02295, partial [Candidatus Binatia bacterium]